MTAPIRVLLLEDAHTDAELMLRELERAPLDVTVRRVETEDDFRQQLAKWSADIILAGYSLPALDGEAALQIARETAPGVPFIFVSGSIGEERAILALRNGATDYILKDRMARLGPAVKRALDERRLLELVSGHVAAEQRQRIQAARVREAQQLAHVGSWELDIVTGAMIWSEEVYRILGMDADINPSADGYLNMIDPADRDRVGTLLESQQRQASPETICLQHRLIRLDGNERTVEYRNRIILNENGVTVSAIGTIQDITERTAAAKTIAELSRRSQLILDCAAEGIIGIRADMSIVFTNPAAVNMLGWSQEQLLASNDWHSIFHHTKLDGTPYPREECPVATTLRDGEKRSVTEEVFWRASGESFAVEYEAAPIVEDGKLFGCVLTFRDVTENQAMERKLELAKRIGSLGRVAATIAHEFNNVMMGIEPFAEMIRRRATNDDRILKAAEQISTSLRRGRRVTEEILRYTQPAEPELRGVDLREWLRELGPELRALAGSTVRVTMSLPDGPAYIACDATQLQQVMTNLLMNAREASPEGGEILITLERVGREHVEILVLDNGRGIPAADIDHIFEPLFTTRRTGTGLGLAVARQIVTRHGGSIDVTNVATGGAEFRVVLPATRRAPVMAALVPQQQQSSERHFNRILLVEDDDLVATGLTALLELEGLAVLTIGRGLPVPEAVESFEPDAVILDLSLPDIDGAEVFRRLRRRWLQLPVVFSTGHGGEVALATALQDERVAMLRKPYNIDELLSALHRVTEV